MKLVPLLALSCTGALFMSGCGAFQQKGERYRNLAEAAGNPEEVSVHYHRKGDTINLSEQRCYGDEACKNMFGDGDGGTP